jgi:hypothetical protein
MDKFDHVSSFDTFQWHRPVLYFECHQCLQFLFATQYYNVIVFFSFLNSSFLISSLIFFCYSRWNKASRGFACEAAIWEMRNDLHSTKVHQLTSCSYEKHIFVLLLLQSWFCFPYLNVYINDETTPILRKTQD